MFVFRFSQPDVSLPLEWHLLLMTLLSILKDWIQGFLKLFLDPWLPNSSVLWKVVPYQSATEGTHWADSKKQCLLLLHVWLWMIWLKSQHTYPLEYIMNIFSLLLCFSSEDSAASTWVLSKQLKFFRKSCLQLPSSLGWFGGFPISGAFLCSLSYPPPVHRLFSLTPCTNGRARKKFQECQFLIIYWVCIP